MDQEEREQIKTRFGEINYEGLEQLEGCYDAYGLNDVIDSIREMVGKLISLQDNMERLRAGARELIDGEASFLPHHYSIEECGNIADFAMEICDELSDCEDILKQANIYVAPLQRLMPTEDGSIYIDYRDTLDKNDRDEE